MSQGRGLSRVGTFIPNLEGKEHRSDSSDVCCAPCSSSTEPLIKPKRKAGDGDGDVLGESRKVVHIQNLLY